MNVILWSIIGIIYASSFGSALQGYNYVGPVFLERPVNKNKEIGKKVTFLCEGYGDNTKLYWLFNGQRAVENKRIHISTALLRSTLTIENVTPDLEGDYCCCLNDYREWLSCCTLKIKRAPVILSGPVNGLVVRGRSVNFSCEVSAHPTPTIAWLHNGLIICREKTNKLCTQASKEFSTHYGFLEIFNATETDVGFYQCNASNKLGITHSDDAHLEVTEPETTATERTTREPRAKIYIYEEESTTSTQDLFLPATTKTSASSLISATMSYFDQSLTNRTFVTVFSLSDNDYHNNLMNPNSALFVILFLGLSLALFLIIICYRKGRRRPRPDIVKIQIGRTDKKRQAFRNKNHTMQRFKYPMNRLKIEQELGEGVFGLVYKARAPGLLAPHEIATVAVKMIRSSDRDNASKVEDFSREAELLSTFQHQNIIQLLGICLEDDYSDDVHSISCLLFEYMDGGDLCAYLRNLGPNRTFFGRSTESEQSTEEITERDKLTMCIHIACGMEYLAERNFIHRDLATRNCLISGRDCNIKIADFGLSRRTYESDYYKAGDTESVPIRWMSPEAVLYGKYSSQSDVWAYGVVLWEIYSYALQPYFSLTNEEVICCICQGKTLSPPSGVLPWMYNLMQLCWNHSPEKRPNFSTIHSVLQAISLNDGELPSCEILLPAPQGFDTMPETSVMPQIDASCIKFGARETTSLISSHTPLIGPYRHSIPPPSGVNFKNGRLSPLTTNGSLKPRRAVSSVLPSRVNNANFQRFSCGVLGSGAYIYPSSINTNTRSDSCLPDSPLSAPYDDSNRGSGNESIV